MLLWVISMLLLNSSEVYPSAIFTLDICQQSRRSAASLQSNLPSFPKTTHFSDFQQHCCRSICQISWTQLIASSFVDKPRTESHSSLYNEEIMCCSEWLECLSWSYTEFFSSACHSFYIYHYLSHLQYCWRVTSQLFPCFVDSNLNQRRLEQDPSLGGLVGGLRTVFIKFEIFIFLIRQLNTKTSRNDIMQHFLGLHGSPGPNSKKFSNNGSFHACPGLKGPLSPDEG